MRDFSFSVQHLICTWINDCKHPFMYVLSEIIEFVISDDDNETLGHANHTTVNCSFANVPIEKKQPNSLYRVQTMGHPIYDDHSMV